MAEQNYHGQCQCGAVSFEVDVDLDDAITCDCSRCQRLGSVLAFAPLEKLKLESGEDNLTEYLFNTGRIAHLFCRTCGIEGFARGSTGDGTKIAAINVNCLDGVDPRAIKATHVHGSQL